MASETAHAAVEPVEGTGAPYRRRALPFSAVLGVATGLGLLVSAADEMRDIDLYWHIRAGAEIVSGSQINELGTQWSFAPDPLPWTSTQWLSEVALYYTHAWGGWTAIAAIRLLTAAIAIAVLAHTTLRCRPAALAGLPYLVAMIGIVGVSQERPQQASLIGAAALGGVLVAGLTRGALPRYYLLLPAVVLWANLHGGWILAPIVLGVIAVGLAADHGVSDRTVWRAASLAAMALACGLITPAGLSGVTAAFRFREATTAIVEWQPTEPLHAMGLLTVPMLVLIGVGWARSPRVPLSEPIGFFVCLVFAWTAWRNVAPGLVLAAPLVAHRLTTAFPRVGRNEPSWSVPVGIGTAAVLAALGLASLVGREHLPVSSQPITLATQLAGLPEGQRVLNDYNAAGLVLFFGGDSTRVGIDGRADRYGSEYIERYVGLRTLTGEWQSLLDELDPTSALFKDEHAIVHVLETERGWRVIGRENGWVLMVPADT